MEIPLLNLWNLKSVSLGISLNLKGGKSLDRLLMKNEDCGHLNLYISCNNNIFSSHTEQKKMILLRN